MQLRLDATVLSSAGADDRTPAMRLGLGRKPLTLEDLPGPGQRIPRPRRSRRRGRKAPAELVAWSQRGRTGCVRPGSRA